MLQFPTVTIFTALSPRISRNIQTWKRSLSEYGNWKWPI